MRPAYPYDRTRWGIGAFVSLAIPAAAVFIWREPWWPMALFVVWTIGAAAIYTYTERRRMVDLNIRMLDHARQSAICTLSHHRHDWMNDLQILYGYLTLNKPDKAALVVDRIRERMENDSRVSQLGNSELASYLLSFRTICDHIRLDVHVADGLNLDRVGADSEKLAAGLIGLINGIRCRVSAGSSGDNVLRLSLYTTGPSLTVELEYEGEWPAGQSLAGEAGSLLHGMGELTEVEETEPLSGASRRVTVTFPLTA